MLLVVGLGNIGKEYENTRHNVGFNVINKLEGKLNLEFNEEKKFKGLISKCNIGSEKVIFLKPTTYMNLSGEAVSAVMNYYKIDINDVIIICDDLDMEVGKVRFRKEGSSGGHNGLKNIELHLSSSKFRRIKIGISRDKNIPVIDWVLTKPHGEDLEKLNHAYDKVTDAIINYVSHRSDEKLMIELSK